MELLIDRNQIFFILCGNYDSDNCLEWSSTTSCPSGKTCTNGECITTCTNLCSSGEKECITSTTYKECGNYDSDTCLEWSSSKSCSSRKTYSNGDCIISDPRDMIEDAIRDSLS